MKNCTKLIFVFCILFCTVRTGLAQDAIHPYNKMLMKLYPRPFEFKYPEVPRILARDALLLHKNGQAVFIGCGASTLPIAGGFYFRDCARIGIKELRAPLSNNKLLIVY
jgi:hypothetical protein